MKPAWASGCGDARIHLGDARTTLASLEPKSVQCCVTSPPYWGLRAYVANDSPLKAAEIGSEPTLAEYVQNLVGVFRLVREAMRDDGTLWLNLGDSYSNTGNTDTSKCGGFTGARIRAGVKGIMDTRPRAIQEGMKPKDLCGIPWAVAFALRDDGWYLRSDIIWSKVNPMPESVRDRPTKSHEYIFLLSKSGRYYYDADAIAEDAMGKSGPYIGSKDQNGTLRKDIGRECQTEWGTRNKRTVWTIPTQAYSEAHFATFPEALVEPCIKAGCPEGGLVLDPFTGSGTVGQVALRYGRRFVGCELNPDYLRLAIERITPETCAVRLPLFSRTEPMQ